jgi:hypothetical protein
MRNSRKFMTAALAAAMLAGALTTSTSASAWGRVGYGWGHRHHYGWGFRHHRWAYAAAHPRAAGYWSSFWGLGNPGCGFWGSAGCGAAGVYGSAAPVGYGYWGAAYPAGVGYCGPAFPGSGSVTGLGYYGADYTIGYSGGC